MKKFLIAFSIMFFSTTGYQVAYADQDKPKTKRVCIEQKDAKTGKVKEVCKNVKVHKKHEGTKVPEKAPAKKNDKK
jgi:hypothetical protein